MCSVVFQVAALALISTSLGGSKQCAGSFAASLIDRILERVPLGSKLGLNAVLFLRTIENSCSSSALECGIVNTSLATVVSRGKQNELSTALMDAK